MRDTWAKQILVLFALPRKVFLALFVPFLKNGNINNGNWLLINYLHLHPSPPPSYTLLYSTIFLVWLNMVLAYGA